MARRKSNLKRAWTVDDVASTKHEKLDLSPEWKDAFAAPNAKGVWFIWANSGNGKTSFVAQLAKELCRFGKVIYDQLEEGNSDTMQDAYKRIGMNEARGKLMLVYETMEELDERLSKPKAPKIVIIDSWQYTFMTFKAWLTFRRKHSDKLIIIISQAEGKNPKGKTADSVMYDAALKIWVEGFKAFSKGRYFGKNGGIYTIWAKGAAEYHGG